MLDPFSIMQLILSRFEIPHYMNVVYAFLYSNLRLDTSVVNNVWAFALPVYNDVFLRRVSGKGLSKLIRSKLCVDNPHVCAGFPFLLSD